MNTIDMSLVNFEHVSTFCFCLGIILGVKFIFIFFKSIYELFLSPLIVKLIEKYNHNNH